MGHAMTSRSRPRVDRRYARSTDPLVALHFQLDAAARRSGMDALVLADRDGLRIAGGGRCEDRERYDSLASMCPLVVREGGNCFDGRLDAPGDRDMSVLMFSYRGQTLYLAGLAPYKDVPTSSAMLDAMEGVMRILA